MSKQIWLLDLPDCMKAAGLDYRLFDGWETRSRSSGGYDDLLGVGYHHDASSSTSNDDNTDAYGWLNAQDKPIGAMRLHRDGLLVIGAAGATNTMGKGAPLSCSKGTVPLDRGNQTLIAIEAANNGVGETWPKVQVDAYVALVAGLCKWYGFDPQRDIFGHFDYVAPSCPSRKIDPAGPAAAPYTDLRGTNSSGTWKLSAFRNHCSAWRPPGPTPEPPTPTPTPTEDDDMLFCGRLNTNPNLLLIGNGVMAQRVRSAQMTTFNKQVTLGRFRDPTKTGSPAITTGGAIPTMTQDDLDLLVGQEAFEALTDASDWKLVDAFAKRVWAVQS
jgi:hypothetical protein